MPPEPGPHPATDAAAISVRGLVKRYGEIEAVAGVDFEVHRGELFGFLGPNGAGKTTTINVLCTLVRPTAGEARVAGYDVRTQRDEVRRAIGLVFQDTTLDGYLTGWQNLRFHAELYGVPRAEFEERARRLLGMVDLWDRRNDLVRTYSGGMMRRLEIVRGRLHAPHVRVLVVPTHGLDPQTLASIWDHVRELRSREDVTVFFTTHYMDEAEECDRIAIIDHGKIVALDTPQALKASVGADRVQITTEDDARAIAALRERFGIEAGVHDGAVTFSVPEGERFVPRLFGELGVPIRSVAVARPTLDDVFLAYAGRTIRDAEAEDPMRRMAAAWLGRRR